jgi:hypothetical protein
MDDGQGSDFYAVAGFSPYSMQPDYTITNVTRGNTFRLRYRVVNAIGFSDYSTTLFALVATFPSPPPPVSLISATDSTITLSMRESANSGGSKIQTYELWHDSGV